MSDDYDDDDTAGEGGAATSAPINPPDGGTNVPVPVGGGATAGDSPGPLQGGLLGRFPVQSPALLLDHEFGHADQWLRDPVRYLHDLNARTGDDWDNAEERRNIQDVETPAALQMGEPTRTSHRGIYVPAPTVPSLK